MKLTLERIIIKNRAPFEEELDLSFNENEIAVLTAVNGRGKTTILSYIVDVWHEIARAYFPNEFEGKETKFYRVSSPLFNLRQSDPSFVYIRFRFNGEAIDYVDIRNECTLEQYNEITLEDKIPFDDIKKTLEENKWIKKISKSLNKKKTTQIFNNNVVTYFPAYRYEIPGYLNDPYRVHLDFTKEMSYSGYLPNPLEVVTGLSQLANWIMDVVLDMNLYKRTQDITFPDGQTQTIDVTRERTMLWSNLNKIMQQTLASKKYEGVLHFAIGKRNSGGTRISIVSDEIIDGKDVQKQIYPTIFNLSSGEATMLCVFGEIIRQADKNSNSIGLQQTTGIILIDEIDKHLHIKLQKEVLPLLFNLFPNVQFIVSSHSPFFNMGLAENKGTKERATIVDLDQNGLRIPVQENSLYQEVYQMMINENENYAKMYEDLSVEHEKPILFVEDTYTQIYKVAWLKLNDVGFDENDMNDKFDLKAHFRVSGKGNKDNLQGFLDNPCMAEWGERKIVGLFDFDDAYVNYQRLKNGNWTDITVDDVLGLCKKRQDCNVYATMLPIPDFRKQIAGRDQAVNKLEVELLLTDEKIKEAYGDADYATEKIIEGLLIPKIQNKEHFWKKALKLDKKAFEAFKPLFEQLDKIFTPEPNE